VTPEPTRVELAPLRDSDSPVLFEWINDRALVTLSAAFRPIGRDEHDAWFDDVRRRPDTRIFGIRLREDDRLVGSCQLHGIHPVHRSAELQIRLGDPDARGRGLGTEAVRQLLAVGFDDLDLHRIALHVLETNAPARGLYERTGFRTEGVLKEAAFIEGEWVNILVMALLRSEYDTSS